MDLERYRDDFPITRNYAFLNHAALAPLSTPVREALVAYMEQIQTRPLDRLVGGMETIGQELKERAAALIGAARPDEIVTVPGTAAGINIAANSLPLQPGDNVVVLNGDYPANIYPWLNLAPRGVLTKWVPQREGGLDLDALSVHIDPRTRVIALSTAMFATGFKNDIQAVGQLCRERGIFFVVDAIQTLGAFPIDVQASGIDFLACGSQKWLLSISGTGILYCRHELLDRLQLGAYVGAASTVDAFNFLDYNFTLLPTSQRFALGAPNFLGTVALHAALGMLGEIGIERIAERIISLADALIVDLRSRGYCILSNLESEHRSGIVIVGVPDPQEAHDQLRAHHVITSVRGQGLRISPHFYNSEEDVMRVGEVLGSR